MDEFQVAPLSASTSRGGSLEDKLVDLISIYFKGLGCRVNGSSGGHAARHRFKVVLA